MLACRVGEMQDGECRRLEADPPVALFRVDGRFYATADTCTHEEWSLGEDGELEGHEVICCLHMARFDVRDGQVKALPATEPLAVYPVRIDADEVWITMEKVDS